MDDSEGSKTSVEEVTADMVEVAKEQELKRSLNMGLIYCNLKIKL